LQWTAYKEKYLIFTVVQIKAWDAGGATVGRHLCTRSVSTFFGWCFHHPCVFSGTP